MQRTHPAKHRFASLWLGIGLIATDCIAAARTLPAAFALNKLSYSAWPIALTITSTYASSNVIKGC